MPLPDLIDKYRSSPKRYPDYDTDEAIELENQLAHELLQDPNFNPGNLQSLKAYTEKLASKEGILPGSIDARYSIPTYVFDHVKDKYRNKYNVVGVTLPRGIAYPRSSNNKDYMVVLDPSKSKEAQATTLWHELKHVKENQKGLGQASDFAEAYTNQGRHFNDDTRGQMFNAEGKKALELMVERLEGTNKSQLLREVIESMRKDK